MKIWFFHNRYPKPSDFELALKPKNVEYVEYLKYKLLRTAIVQYYWFDLICFGLTDYDLVSRAQSLPIVLYDRLSWGVDLRYVIISNLRHRSQNINPLNTISLPPLDSYNASILQTLRYGVELSTSVSLTSLSCLKFSNVSNTSRWHAHLVLTCKLQPTTSQQYILRDEFVDMVAQTVISKKQLCVGRQIFYFKVPMVSTIGSFFARFAVILRFALQHPQREVLKETVWVLGFVIPYGTSA